MSVPSSKGNHPVVVPFPCGPTQRDHSRGRFGQGDHLSDSPSAQHVADQGNIPELNDIDQISPHDICKNEPGKIMLASANSALCFMAGVKPKPRLAIVPNSYSAPISSSGRSLKLCKSNIAKNPVVVTNVCGAPGLGLLGPLPSKPL